MRIGSSSLSQNKSISESNVSKGIIPNQNKNFKPLVSDQFQNLNAWDPIRGTWSTNGSTLTTSSAASLYPILTSYDLKSQNITATMSLTSAGPGIVFWLQDENNWWAGATFYTTSSESYITGTYSCNCVPRGFCYGIDGNGFPWGCESCSTCYYTSTRTRYDFFLRLFNAVNGSISVITNVLIRSTCSVSTQWSPCTASSADNINGIQIETSGNSITIRGRNDANSFYSTILSHSASSPNRGYKSGVIFTPGSNYLLNSEVQNITIVGS